MNKIEFKKCPEGGGEMERGHIPLLEGIRWRTEENHWGELLKWGGIMWPKKLEGYLCRNCQLLLLHY